MFKLYTKRVWSAMRRDPVLLALLILAIAYFLLYYITDPVRPADILPNWFGHHDHGAAGLGWFTFYDQSQYLRLAHTMASFNFHQFRSTFDYGIGYPLVAVPFIWLGFDKDPFVFFNLAAFVFAAYAAYRVGKRFISPFGGFLAGFGLIFASPLIQYTDIPWNSTVCLVVMSAILILLTVKKINKWHVFILGLLLGWAFAARYVDVIWLGILGLISIYRGSFKTLARQSVYLLIGLAIFVVPVMYAQYKVFGSPLRTPYVTHLGIGGVGGSDQGLHAYSVRRIPRAGLALFVSPRLAGSADTNRGLFINMFWALAAIPGVIILFRKNKYRIFVGCFVVLDIIATLFYLSFRASTPGSLVYGELHYFKMWWPGTILLAVVFFDYLMNLYIKKTTPAPIKKPSPSKKQPL